MCGFAGFLAHGDSTESAEQRLATLRAMGRAISHRGPDDEQYYVDGRLSVVFRRLSIVDLAGGRQPLFSADGNQFVVVNGEIYNHEALRGELAPRHTFSSRSDSEVALHLLGEQGADGLCRMNGMFALVFWDRREQSLLLARDRLGIKPLYIAELADGLLFGSELKALMAHPRCPRDLDWSVLDIPVVQLRSPVATYVHGVEHLPGGHCLVARNGRVNIRRWWNIDEHLGSARHGLDAARYQREYHELLETAAVEHLLSDVPVGLHLSGGLDSSLLAAICAAKKSDLACFSVVERNSFLSGDVASAQRTTQQLGLPWYPILFDHRTLLDEMAFDLARLEQSVFMMDSPRFDLEWIFKEELHRAAKRECPGLKVVLLGQGADEFAGGYSRRIDRPRSGWSEYIDSEVVPNLRFCEAIDDRTPERLCRVRRIAGDSRKLSSYHHMMHRLTFQLQHFNLWHEDRTSMFQSLEARVPFLDHRLVELLASVPASLQPELFWNKQIVRDVARARLPSFDPNHPKVPFFVTGDTRSIDIILHAMLQRTVPAFLAKYPDLPAFPFEPAAVRALAADVLGRSGAFYRQGWALMEIMVIAIFREQCLQPAQQDFVAVRERRDGPALVASVQWPKIKTEFEAQPMPPTANWQADDRLRIPDKSEILHASGADGSNRFLLANAGSISAEINVPAQIEWLPRLLRNLGREATSEFTVSDWEDEFELSPAQFRNELDTLYAAGFVQKSNAAELPRRTPG